MVTRLAASVSAWSILVLTLGAAASAKAQDQDQAREGDMPSVHVQIADLNLQTSTGQATALRRILRAADVVCGGEPDIHRLAARVQYQKCRDTALQGALPQLGPLGPTILAQLVGHDATAKRPLR